MNLAKTVRTLARFFPTPEDGQAETSCAPKRITLGVHEGMRPSYLAFADVLIVTGESESMLAEAAATHKPVYIYPLPERPGNVKSQLKEWIVACAQAAPA